MLHGGETSWPYIVTLELGTYFVDMMVKNLKIRSDIINPAHDRKLIPILYHMYAFRSTRQVQYVPVCQSVTQSAVQAVQLQQFARNAGQSFLTQRREHKHSGFLESFGLSDKTIQIQILVSLNTLVTGFLSINSDQRRSINRDLCRKKKCEGLKLCGSTLKLTLMF